MLNKKICKTCTITASMQTTERKWVSDNFEKYWEEDKKCLCSPAWRSLPIWCEPPKECPYKLEQLLSDDSQNIP